MTDQRKRRDGDAPSTRAPGVELLGRTAAPCPICGKPVDAAFRPFCSQRCADVDLGRWLGERYVIPGPVEDLDENGPA